MHEDDAMSDEQLDYVFKTQLFLMLFFTMMYRSLVDWPPTLNSRLDHMKIKLPKANLCWKTRAATLHRALLNRSLDSMIQSTKRRQMSERTTKMIPSLMDMMSCPVEISLTFLLIHLEVLWLRIPLPLWAAPMTSPISSVMVRWVLMSLSMLVRRICRLRHLSSNSSGMALASSQQ
ncbi:unnamed protein product, partial [Prorocentrum cordatum]